MSDRNAKRKQKLKKKKAKSLKRSVKSDFFAIQKNKDGSPNVLHRITYNITEEPLTPASEQIFSDLDQKKYAEAFESLRDGRAKAAIPIFQELLVSYPKAGRLYNNLAACYESLGEMDKSEEMIKINYNTNPTYLFGRLDYANYCVNHDAIDEVPKIFNGLYDLKLLYPERDTFHIMEVLAFNRFMALYFALINRTETAMMYAKILMSLSPCDPILFKLISLIRPRVTENFVQGKGFFDTDSRKIKDEILQHQVLQP
jgi:tetratricopeptide (TPR) repeat protein